MGGAFYDLDAYSPQPRLFSPELVGKNVLKTFADTEPDRIPLRVTEDDPDAENSIRVQAGPVPVQTAVSEGAA